jgi:hypothetical protein
MTAANQTLYRRFYREVFTPALTPFQFARVGQQNVWRKDTSGGLTQLIGAGAGWHGGRRELEWDIFVPGLDDLMRGDGPPLPLGGRIALGYCHVSGRVSDLIQSDVLANRPELTGDFELIPDQTADDRRQLEQRAVATLRLFASSLESLQSLEDVLTLLTLTDPAGKARFMPSRTLTPVYAAGIAILARSPDLKRVIADLEAARSDWSALQSGFPSGKRVWGLVADRLLHAAQSIDR